MSYDLSKTKYCKGVQCPKILWMDENMPEVGENVLSEAVMDNGTHVGEVARGYFGEYDLVEYDYDKNKMAHQTLSGCPCSFYRVELNDRGIGMVLHIELEVFVCPFVAIHLGKYFLRTIVFLATFFVSDTPVKINVSCFKDTLIQIVYKAFSDTLVCRPSGRQKCGSKADLSLSMERSMNQVLRKEP